jgi:pimeloyl-ACP methyl ester carboxylesterase
VKPHGFPDHAPELSIQEGRMSFSTQHWQVNGITLNVVVEGSGPDVLLVHGFPDTHDVWRNQIPTLIAAGYRVIAPDMRGCGDSDAPAGIAPYDVHNLVADLAALLDAMDVAKVRLVAHDWGAAIAWQFCIKHPARVDRYAALSVGHPTAYAKAPLRQKIMGWYVLFLQLRGIAEWMLRAGNWWFLRLITHYDAEMPRWIKSISRPGRLTAAINYYRANLGMALPRAWPAVTMPVMGVWSDGDRFLCEEQMKATQGFVKAPWRYERVDGANHWMQLTAPERLNALLLDYLR